MSSIIISSDSYEIGCGIAKETANALHYTCIDREEIFPMISAKSGVDRDKLQKALDGPPPLFGRSAKMWRQLLAYIQEATLGQLLNDNVACHGLAAHLYVMGISHILKVRIITSEVERLKILTSQRGISMDKAKKILKRQEKQHREWCLQAFQLDETDPSRYDMVISLSQISPEEAVKTITGAVGYQKFSPMTYSIKCLHDLELESRVRVGLIMQYPDAVVSARDGTVVVKAKALKRERRKKAVAIKELVGGIHGVDYVEVHFVNDIIRQAAESFR